MQSYKDLNLIYNGCDLRLNNKQITSLAGCPEHITGTFNCSENGELTSLVGGPQIVDNFYTCANTQVTDLVGCASHIGTKLYCWGTKITSLVGMHKILKSCTSIAFDDDTIIVGGIGLLLIENLKIISANSEPFKIIKKYLGQGTKGMMACRAELIKMGYENYAKL